MAKKGGVTSKVGGWAFLVGVILALVFGLLGSLGSLTQTWVWLLVLIGIIVGFLNITEAESQKFLWSGAVLIIASAFGQSSLSAIPVFNNILDSLLAVFVPATVIVAIRNVFTLARD